MMVNDLGDSNIFLGHKSGHIEGHLASLPPELAEIISTWPELDKQVQTVVLVIIRNALSANAEH